MLQHTHGAHGRRILRRRVEFGSDYDEPNENAKLDGRI